VKTGRERWTGNEYSPAPRGGLIHLAGFNFRSVISSGAYTYASISPEWESLRDARALLFDQWMTAMPESAIKEYEKQSLVKAMTSWRAIGLGRLLFKETMEVRNEAQAEALAPYFDWIADGNLSQLPSIRESG
jgi:hypothetical protein